MQESHFRRAAIEEHDECPVCHGDVADCQHAVERARRREEKILAHIEKEEKEHVHVSDCAIYVGEACDCMYGKDDH